jgi:SAM-dependent methyltransferase
MAAVRGAGAAGTDQDAPGGGRRVQTLESYVLGTNGVEAGRLLRQAARLEAETHDLLDAVGLLAGWRALDVGCGPLGILNVLAERVGSGGEVVGIEREPRLLARAREQVDAAGWRNVRLVAGDVLASGEPRGSFDLVHERQVLVVSPEPERMLAAMVALTRPGGVVVLQDVDVATAYCYPPHAAWDRVRELFETAYAGRGLDVRIGQRLVGLLLAAGLEDVQVRVQANGCRGGAEAAADFDALHAGVREEQIAQGLATRAELDALAAALRQHLADPGTVVVRALLFQAWGRKPLHAPGAAGVTR